MRRSSSHQENGAMNHVNPHGSSDQRSDAIDESTDTGHQNASWDLKPGAKTRQNLLTQKAKSQLFGEFGISNGPTSNGSMGALKSKYSKSIDQIELLKNGDNFVAGSSPNFSQSQYNLSYCPSSNNRTVRQQDRKQKRRQRSRIFDDPAVIAGYASVPLIEMDRLPRGGTSLETQAVGRIQFGIPPETIKDSMRLGFSVPSVYIVPVERFCREMGPALGINLAEFEFPAYFNYFVFNKRCTLIVDSTEAESNIRRVFGETLLGPAIFRDHKNPLPNEDEDFDPNFPRESRPNFYKEFYHFRTAEESSNFEELTIDMLLDFCHFRGSQQSQKGSTRSGHEKLGVPPVANNEFDDSEDEEDNNKYRRHSSYLRDEAPVTGRHSERGNRMGQIEENTDMLHDVKTSVDDLNNSTSSRNSVSGLRRIVSNPDFKRLSLDSLIQSIPANSAKESQPEHSGTKMARRGSVDSIGSFGGGKSRDGMSWADGASFMLASDDEEDPQQNSWMYSQAKWLGEVATVYPRTATEEQKRTNKTPRVEIFKMTGGTEYIVHDIDENNIIIGKARFSGTVRVPDEMAVEGFLTSETEALQKQKAMADKHDFDENDDMDDFDPIPGKSKLHRRLDDSISDCEEEDEDIQFSIPRPVVPPTFHPPSFGVTVLGNSHGFDKNGSTSGYVLWINGRGVMIDPPPYSSATLEREGIRPNMIMAIIITHCHADHDAGTFQKVMTGSRVAIITTSTIYKSFIRKYAALSGLSPALLRHSHRHRPAVVGQPLKFQGATFNFTYTLHTIPCIAFKVEWRGRSMVFTGDHLNSPPVINDLESTGVLTKERADDLRRLPLQDCDALLHEAGAPPIHTPLSVLKELPEHVKERLYVVHTSKLPDDCELRVAPTGTAGTIRLDQVKPKPSPKLLENQTTMNGTNKPEATANGETESHLTDKSGSSITDIVDPAGLDDGAYPNLTVAGNFVAPNMNDLTKQLEPTNGDGQTKSSIVPPLVFLRPTCVSDAWFILNLLSAVPFLSSLSYSNTMEVLEIAQVEMFCANEVVIPKHRRSEVLCVVWEGTCVERDPGIEGGDIPLGEYALGYDKSNVADELDIDNVLYVDSGDGLLRRFNPTVWHAGDWTGPLALQPNTERSAEVPNGESPKDVVALSAEGVKVIMLNMKDLHQILKNGSTLFRKYLALKEKQAAEEAAMKAQMMRNEILAQTDLSYVNAEDENFREEQVPNHWYAYDSVLEVLKSNSALGKLTALQKRHLESLAEGPRFFEADNYLWQVGEPVEYAFLIVTGTAGFAPKMEEQSKIMCRRGSTGMMMAASERPRRENVQHIEEDKQLFNVTPNSEYARLEIGLQLRVEEMELDVYDQAKDLLPKEERMRNARDRFANKVLARLYSRRAFTAGLVFSRGHLLADTSRMVSGSLAHIHHHTYYRDENAESGGGRGPSGGDHHCHTSNMIAGPDGCVVMVFPRSSLVQFLDGNPGVLLSLLGTQVVV